MAPSTGLFLQQARHLEGVGYPIGGGRVQYICLIGCRLPPLDGYVAGCLVLTIDVYDTNLHLPLAVVLPGRALLTKCIITSVSSVLGNIRKASKSNFLTKEAQMLGSYWSCFENHHYLNE